MKRDWLFLTTDRRTPAQRRKDTLREVAEEAAAYHGYEGEIEPLFGPGKKPRAVSGVLHRMAYLLHVKHGMPQHAIAGYMQCSASTARYGIGRYQVEAGDLETSCARFYNKLNHDTLVRNSKRKST